MRSSLFALVCFLLVSFSSLALADTASEAQLQYELGAEMYKQGRYPEAIERFIASNRLVPNANVVANIARTFEFLDRPVDAYNWYVKYLDNELTVEERALGEAAIGQLLPKVAVLDITTDPKGALLFIDRLELGDVGRAPRKVAVRGGELKVLSRMEGFHPGELVVQASLGEVTAVELKLAPIAGALEILTEPPGAEVLLSDGHSLGTTPLAQSLAVGTYTIEARLAGYLPVKGKFTLTEEHPTKVVLKLERDLSQVALLSVRANVAGAEVFLNNKQLGKTPLSAHELDPGAGTLEVRAQGREPYLSSVVLEKGAATRVEVQLADPNDGPWLGYRYLGFGIGGLFLVGGTGVGLYSVSERKKFFEDPSTERYQRVDRMNGAADVLFIVGGAVVVATTVWEILKAPRPKSSGKMELDR